MSVQPQPTTENNTTAINVGEEDAMKVQTT